MKTTILAAIVLLFSFAALADDEKEGPASTDTEATIVLSGSITDENSGESLVGVEVQIEGTDYKAYTDFDGNFSFENVVPGEYKINANYISYQEMSRELELNAQQNEIEIKLQTSN